MNGNLQTAASDRGWRARERAGVPLPGARRVQPEVAAFGEWDTSNLGDHGIHEGVLRFFAGCGGGVRSYGVSSLAPVAPDRAHHDTPSAVASGLVRAPVRAGRARVREQLESLAGAGAACR